MWPFSSSYPTSTPDSIDEHTFDYIVVGGGTGGCALAARLSANPGTTVLLLERGDILTSWLSRVPLLTVDVRLASSPSYKWVSEPSAFLGGRMEVMSSGKAFGGTSKVNAGIYQRSVPAEYNAWNEPEWTWEKVEPAFNRSENSLTHGHLPYRGSQGPWKNKRPDFYYKSSDEVLAASSALGLTYLNCANDPSAPGAGCTRLDLTFGEDGLRQSSFDAFLPPALVRARPNLTIVPKAVCLKIDIAEGRATGIHLEHEDVPGKIYHVHASKEIVLCAGAIGTPQLLMLSGVGPADHLKEVGIPLVLDLPAVGATLQDHPAVRTVWATDVRDTVHAAEHFWLLIRELFLLIIYGTGLFIAPSLHLSIFAHTSLLDESSRCGQVPPDIVPDVEVMPIPCNSQTPHFKDDFGPMEGGFTFMCVPLHPVSTGTVRLRGSDPRDRPACVLGTLSNPADYIPTRASIRLALALAKQMQRQGYQFRPISIPSSDSDEDIDKFARENAETTYHYASSCRMGADGVVDARLRVHGVRNLRIADASVFPRIPAAHLQAPVVMVAERCAEFIEEESRA